MSQNLGPVDDAVEAGHLECRWVDPRGPFLAAEIDGVLLDVVLQLQVGLAGLAAEDVRGLA